MVNTPWGILGSLPEGRLLEWGSSSPSLLSLWSPHEAPLSEVLNLVCALESLGIALKKPSAQATAQIK